jgi:hypothetical protein
MSEEGGGGGAGRRMFFCGERGAGRFGQAQEEGLECVGKGSRLGQGG